MGENIIKIKSYQFALRIFKLYKHLTHDQKEFILSKQILRSGTSIGANIEEASGSQSTKEFIAKFHISLKEAKETHYWLRLIRDCELANTDLINSFIKDCDELIVIITSILKKTKANS